MASEITEAKIIRVDEDNIWFGRSRLLRKSDMRHAQ